MLGKSECGARQNFYVFSLYHNPDLDDRIYKCLLASMAAESALPFCLLLLSLFLTSMGWLYEVGVFRLIRVFSLSPSVALLTHF